MTLPTQHHTQNIVISVSVISHKTQSDTYFSIQSLTFKIVIHSRVTTTVRAPILVYGGPKNKVNELAKLMIKLTIHKYVTGICVLIW